VKMLDAGKTRMIGLPCGEKKNYDDMLSRFHLIPERNGRTDGRTDGQTVSDIWRGSQNKKNRGCCSPQTPLADKFLHDRVIPPANAYKRTKF